MWIWCHQGDTKSTSIAGCLPLLSDNSNWRGAHVVSCVGRACALGIEVPADDAEAVLDGGRERFWFEAAVRAARERDEPRRARVADGDHAEQALDLARVVD